MTRSSERQAAIIELVTATCRYPQYSYTQRGAKDADAIKRDLATAYAQHVARDESGVLSVSRHARLRAVRRKNG